MSTVARIVVVLTLLGSFMFGPPLPSVQAGQTHFSLGLGQSVTVGPYTVSFLGVSGTQPAYELYHGSVLLARFPSPDTGPGQAVYFYGNGRISIKTTGLAPDGSSVIGILNLP